MRVGDKWVMVVGDRVLVKPDNPEERTKVGLYLPQTVIEKEPVQTGRIVATGPGIAIPSFGSDHGEPWKGAHESPSRFIPLQAESGDHALYLKKDAVEVQYQKETYMVVPQAAILLLVRAIIEEPDMDLELLEGDSP